MIQKFKARVDKIKSVQKKLRLTSEQLAAFTQTSMSARELELILGRDDTIYRDEEAIIAIEKALQKASETIVIVEDKITSA